MNYREERREGWFSWEWFRLGLLLGILWGLWRHPGASCCCLVLVLLLAAFGVAVVVTMLWMHPGFALGVALLWTAIWWARRHRQNQMR